MKLVPSEHYHDTSKYKDFKAPTHMTRGEKRRNQTSSKQKPQGENVPNATSRSTHQKNIRPSPVCSPLLSNVSRRQRGYGRPLQADVAGRAGPTIIDSNSPYSSIAESRPPRLLCTWSAGTIDRLTVLLSGFTSVIRTCTSCPTCQPSETDRYGASESAQPSAVLVERSSQQP